MAARRHTSRHPLVDAWWRMSEMRALPVRLRYPTATHEGRSPTSLLEAMSEFHKLLT